VNSQKLVKQLAQYAKPLGIELVRVVQGTHLKLVFSAPAGERTLVVSRSPSDNRAFLNNQAILKRWARERLSA
jgi:hypothetical protein